MDTNGGANERKRSLEVGAAEEGRRTRLRSNIISPTPVFSSAVAGNPSEGNQPAQSNGNEQQAPRGRIIAKLFQQLLLPNEQDAKSALLVLNTMELAKETNKKVRDEVVGAGGCLAVVQSMRNHPKSVQVQCQGFKVLRSMVVGSEKNKGSFTLVGGIEVILEGLRNLQDSKQVQSEGLQLLVNISYKSKMNRNNICENGGIDVILKAMKKFPDSDSVQTVGIAALRNLACAPIHQNKIVGQYQESAISTVIAAMQKHPNYVKTQEHGCAFLSILASKSDDCKEFIRKKGGPSTIGKAYELHVELKEHVKSAMSALW